MKEDCEVAGDQGGVWEYLRNSKGTKVASEYLRSSKGSITTEQVSIVMLAGHKTIHGGKIR